MTAASGDPGEKPDYEGHPPSGFDFPPADPAYGGWRPIASDPPPAYSPPAARYGSGYPPPPAYPPFPGYPQQYGSLSPGGYGYQGYPGYPGYQGYPGYPIAAQPGVNVLAIISVVSSVSGLLCFIGSLAAIITGAIAIAQIKRTGEKGFGMAVAGTAAGVAGLLVYVVMVVYALQR